MNVEKKSSDNIVYALFSAMPRQRIVVALREKMKEEMKTLLSIFLISISYWNAIPNSTLELRGQIFGISDRTKIILKLDVNSDPDTIHTDERGRYHFHIGLSEGTKARLIVLSSPKKVFRFYASPGKMKYSNSLDNRKTEFKELYNLESPGAKIEYDSLGTSDQKRLYHYYNDLDNFWSSHKNAYPDVDKQRILVKDFIGKMFAFIKEAPNSYSSGLIFDDMISFKPLHIESELLCLGYDFLSTKIQQSYYGSQSKNKFERLSKRWIGKSYLDFSFMNMSSEREKVSEYEGSPLLIEFWASWCRPCIQGMPELVRIYEKYQADGLRVIAISIDQDEQSWRRMIPKTDTRFIHGLDFDEEARSNYNINGVPDNILIDKNGVIWGQKLSFSEMEKKLDALFEKE